MKWLKIGLLLLAGLLFTGCTSREDIEESFPMSMEVEGFSAVNQDGEKVDLEDLKGSIWITDFIFTNCDTVCLPMTANMAHLQNKLKEENLESGVKLVSFSIDPENDTPDALKEYSQRYQADLKQWTFLTGYSQEDIELFANRSFNSPAAKVDGSNQFVHGTSFYLVSDNGTVLKQYEGVSDPPFEEIIADIKKLN
ncbi:SCO family protein [Bacillus salacetis]|uniref:SCO family protein n=1 Tax=Bacillus salacetis TaxID=2315464 RepID=A0A3A1R283_9BACI|nr:SCO family protein [Bacillus salacetis]RIW33290.1 SCO family protein [Bacillus salacetis]